jgi:hypothetical protein
VTSYQFEKEVGRLSPAHLIDAQSLKPPN